MPAGSSPHRPGDLLPLKPLDLHVLLVLAEGDRHGYGIMKEVERQTRGSVRLELGSLYRLIDRLMQSGLIEEAAARPRAESGSRRRYYRLSRFGQKVLRAEADRLTRVVQQMRGMKLVDPLKG